jgi:protease I
MTQELAGKKVAFLATDGVEEVELTEPWSALEAAGAEPALVSLEDGEIQAFRHLDRGRKLSVDLAVADVDAGEFDALVLPGGVANPDRLRMDENAVAFVRSFMEQRKPVGVICHGPWTLVEADVLGGRTITSFPSLRTDIVNAGASWVDREVCVDEGLVSSRTPDDLPAFCAKVVEEIAEGVHASSDERVAR